MITYDHDHENEVIALGQTNFRNSNVLFGIKTDDRRRHLYTLGKTGMGKSHLLKFMAIQDIRNGHGVCIVDPHGDFADLMLEYVPDHRLKDIIFFDPSDLDFPIAFNVLEKVDERYKHLVASGLVGVFKKLFAESWGPRLEYILRNCILSLLETEDATMLGITRLLVDKKYRKEVVRQLTDPVVKSFWIDEFENYNDKMRTEAVSPIQNKVGQFLSSAIIRNIVGQQKSTISIEQIMDEGKILILQLAKGKIGEDISALLGAMIITKIQLAAMARQYIPEEDRRDFYLYVDEFQNFATGAFASILSEARKYRLNLIIAHQYIEQMDEEVRDAVFGNVGTMNVFRIGADDAEKFERELEPEFTASDLVNITARNSAIKLMIDGVSSAAFSAQTLPLSLFERTGNTPEAIAYTREHYTRPRAQVEEEIIAWSGMQLAEKPTLPPLPSLPGAPSSGPEKKLPPQTPSPQASPPPRPPVGDQEEEEEDEPLIAIPTRFEEPESAPITQEEIMSDHPDTDQPALSQPIPAAPKIILEKGGALKSASPEQAPSNAASAPSVSMRELLEKAMREKQLPIQPSAPRASALPYMDQQRERQTRSPMPHRRNDDRPQFEATCAIGGERVMVPFKPDGIRPVFCEKHLADARRAKAKGDHLVSFTPVSPHMTRKEKPRPEKTELPPLPQLPLTHGDASLPSGDPSTL